MSLLRIASIALFASKSGIRSLALDLLMRRNVTARAVHDAARSEKIDAAVASCRSDLLDDALSVMLHDLNQTNQVADYQSWAVSHAKSQVFLRGMIRCLPMNANAWIRDAMVSRAIAEDAGSLKTTLELARQLAPFESQLLIARLQIWKKLSPRALTLNAMLVEADVDVALRYGSDKVVKSLPKAAGDGFASLLHRQVLRLPGDRQTIIAPLLDTGR